MHKEAGIERNLVEGWAEARRARRGRRCWDRGMLEMSDGITFLEDREEGREGRIQHEARCRQAGQEETKMREAEWTARRAGPIYLGTHPNPGPRTVRRAA
jgi:hypothetical protein